MILRVDQVDFKLQSVSCSVGPAAMRRQFCLEYGEPEKHTPETPVELGTLATPVEPGTPQTPIVPGTPEIPVEPGTPEAPIEPRTPETPVEPRTPETPVEPGTPGVVLCRRTFSYRGKFSLNSGFSLLQRWSPSSWGTLSW